MTKSDPTGRAYKDALVDVRASVPGAAQAITVHVDHLTRRVAHLELERAGLAKRVDELVPLALHPSTENPAMLIVGNDQTPETVTSPALLLDAAQSLLARLIDPTAPPTGELIVAEAIKQGPLAASVFQLVLQVVGDSSRALSDEDKP